MENERIAMNYCSASNEHQSMPLTTIFICPSTGGSFKMSVDFNESVYQLKWTLSRRLNINKDRIILLFKNRQLKNGLLRDYNIVENSCLTLLPSLETGISYNRRESGVVDALRSLTDAQINDFLTGRAPLVLAMRLGDHMMFIQLQLSTSSTSRARSRSAPVTVPPYQHFSVRDHQEIPSPTCIPESRSNTLQSNLHKFRHFPDNEKTCSVSPLQQGSPNTSNAPRGGAVIESMKHLGRGVYSGTFSGKCTLDRSLHDKAGQPRRDIGTIVHILNDLLEATPQYRQHCFIPTPQSVQPERENRERTKEMNRDSTSEEDTKLRGKVRHLQMMMEARKQRRRVRRNIRAPYQWQRQQDKGNQYSSPNSQSEVGGAEGVTSEEMLDPFLSLDKTLAV